MNTDERTLLLMPQEENPVVIRGKRRQLLKKMFGTTVAVHASDPPERPSSQEDLLGAQFGSYQIEHEIGAGGMGEVYSARHLGDGSVVALKVLSNTTGMLGYRFKREFRALADVTHYNLIKLFELGVGPRGQTFFTMELLKQAMTIVEWVHHGTEQGSCPPSARITSAISQLISGVNYLHGKGCIHRDLKPSNVMVTPSGRVVILDFGLISEVDHGITRKGQVLGTPAYMAPEQARGVEVRTAADLYAVGVILYQCLTGELPPLRPVGQSSSSKQFRTTCREALRHTPPPLRKLCVDLLEHNPDLRPNNAEVLALLGIKDTIKATTNSEFVGREDELATLHDSCASISRSQSPVVIHLRGDSGQGKSAIIREFRSQLRGYGYLVLHGCCRERENIPFKGVDAIIDSLAAHLHRLPPHVALQMRPRAADALAKMFPVFGDLWPGSTNRQFEPHELRDASWAALRELIATTTRHSPLIIIIDDFQWTDIESVHLLEYIMRPEGMSPLLLLLALRADTSASPAMGDFRTSEVLTAGALEVNLGPLTRTDARKLASNLLAQSGADHPTSKAESIAIRSGGHAMFIANLVRQGGSLDSTEDLDYLLAKRFSELDRPGQQILSVVSVSGGPLPKNLVFELCSDVSQRDVASLCMDDLLAEDASDAEDESFVDIAHDRIRAVALDQITAQEAVHLHSEIGKALLRRKTEHTHKNSIFRIVDHLNAGYQPSATNEMKLELARLNLEAGEHALNMASYDLARAYLEAAYDVAHPWIQDAHSRQSQYDLCVSIMFGRLRSTRELDESGAIFDELFNWTLTTSDYGKVGAERILALTHSGAVEEGLSLSLVVLRKIGVRLPRKPTFLWALWQFTRGHYALGRKGITKIEGSSEALDPRVRVAVSVIGQTAEWWAQSQNPQLGIGLAGILARLISAHGFCNGAGGGLVLFCAILVASGRHQQALAVHNALVSRESRWPMSAADRAGIMYGIIHFSPLEHPIFQVAARVQALHSRCVEIGQYRSAALFRSGGLTLHVESDTPLSRLLSLHGELQLQVDLQVDSEYDRISQESKIIWRVLIEGRDSCPLPDPEMFGMMKSAQYAFVTRKCWTEVLFMQFDAAWNTVKHHIDDYDTSMGGSYLTPILAMMITIIAEERWETRTLRERIRLARTIRKCHKVVERYSRSCPTNFAPMLEIVRAEAWARKGRSSEAMAGFERARIKARANRMLWVAGLASHRLAVWAKRNGHGLVVRAALHEAREFYSAWGARGLVRELDAHIHDARSDTHSLSSPIH